MSYDDVIELAKRRGYLYPSFEIYGGAAGFWDYGPLGTALMNNVLDSWRELYVVGEGFEEIRSTTIGKEDVFRASGHAEGFADVLVQCNECKAFYRADHLVEDHTEVENADGFSKERLADIIHEEEIHCPGCGALFTDPDVRDFNLMFETNIGPESGRKAYLRPETAQGIFVDFHRLKRYFREQLPFGVTQIGTAYRNEINPRKGVVRLREFNQAELEYFKHPESEKSAGPVRGVEVRLYPAEEQLDRDGEPFTMTVGEAVDEGVIESESIAYFVGRSQEWYESLGIDPERLRWRQHLGDERAHYASDCWDGETETSFGWIEVNGVADRSSYDLRRHMERSGEELGVFREYDEALEREEAVVTPDMSVLGPRYGDRSSDIADALRELADSPEVFEGDVVEVEVDGETVEVELSAVDYEVRTERVTGENILPQVIEPSYGVDRIVYSILEHCLDTDVVDEEERTVLRLPPGVAPVTAAVLPLVSKDGLDEMAESITDELRGAGLRVKYDDSGGIGRRYRRHDEIGTPFAVTVDYDSLEDDTVTVRDRDTVDQVRVDLNMLAETLRGLRDGSMSFGDL